MAPEDILCVSEIVSECYCFLAKKQGFSDNQLQGLLSERGTKQCIAKWFDKYQTFVSEDDSKLLGVLGTEKNDIGELWVLPSHHGRKIGKTLFQKAEQEIAKAGYPKLTVRTTGYAVPFYKAMGAFVVDQRPCAFGPMKGWNMTYLEKPLQTNGDK